jgi:hypothetical protein
MRVAAASLQCRVSLAERLALPSLKCFENYSCRRTTSAQMTRRAQTLHLDVLSVHLHFMLQRGHWSPQHCAGALPNQVHPVNRPDRLRHTRDQLVEEIPFARTHIAP